MLLRHLYRTTQEIIIYDLFSAASVNIVPSKVDTVPFAVIHLDVIPHMSAVGIRIQIACNAYTRDVHSVAHKLERFGIAFADNAGLYHSADSGRREICISIIICEFRNSTFKRFEPVISGEIFVRHEISNSLFELFTVLVYIFERLKSIKIRYLKLKSGDRDLVSGNEIASGGVSDTEFHIELIEPEYIRNIKQSSTYSGIEAF